MSSKKPEKKRKKKHDDEPVMAGQTEEERRKLRQEQRALFDRLGSRQQEMSELRNDAFEEEWNANNELFKKVRFTREMGTDGDNLVVISEVAVKRASALAKSVSQYSAEAIGKALCQEFAMVEGRPCEFDWAKLGAEAAYLFRTPPELDFLCGLLNQPAKQNAVERKKKHVDYGRDTEETRYETWSGATKKDGDGKDEATNMRLDKIVEVMAKEMGTRGLEPEHPKQEPQGGIGVLDLLVNKDSFCETVENFFDLSFLVKDGRACIENDPETGLPVTRLTDIPDEAVPKTQNVVVLSMADCARIGALWNLGETKLRRANNNNADDGAE